METKTKTKTRVRKIGFSLKINTRRKDDFHASAPDLRIDTGIITPSGSLSATTSSTTALKNSSPNSPTTNRRLAHLEQLHRKYEDEIKHQNERYVR